MLYLKWRKSESWGAMLMLSIYVYLLWGWRQWELSNILVKCLEDLWIKLKPAEVSCKSCSALLGARVMYCVWVTVNIPLGKPRSTLCSWLPWARAGAWLAPSGYYSATGKSLLPCCQGRNVAVPPRPCLQHHRMGTCALSGSRQSLACLSFSCTPKEM